jgi:outer membrane protein OmpA-like peptidoglycan-associated protein
LVLLPFLCGILHAQTGKYYLDGHGDSVYVPLGDIAFADAVVSYTAGKPAPVKGASDPKNALGIPDWDYMDHNFLTLGCGGNVVLRFTDNVIMDLPGPDIFVFELGKYVESTVLEISKDGKDWLKIGAISGGQTSVDLKGKVQPFESFAYIRLTDMKTSCDPTDGWPGADIDAVAAIGAGRSISLKSSVLFDSGRSNLKPTAQTELDKVVNEIKKMKTASLVVEGYTDSIGNKTNNLTLSKNRAAAVSAYLSSKLGKTITVKILGYGDSYPVATNSTDAGREMNRRVEIIIVPGKLQ